MSFNTPTSSGGGGGGVPVGIIAYLKDGVCVPACWVEECRARGRYIAGLPSGGCVASSIGTALSNKECRPVGQHTHTVSVTDPGHTHSYAYSASGSCAAAGTHTSSPGGGGGTTGSSTTGISATTANPAGSVAGTPAPYIQFKAIRKSIAGGNPPSGVIAFLKDLVCVPAGWVEECRARGRYIVGLPSGGCAASTVGTALSNKECRPVGQHTHTVSITDGGHTHSYTKVGGGSSNAVGGSNAPGTTNGCTSSNTTGITMTTANPAGSVAGTPSPYIQFKAVRKS